MEQDRIVIGIDLGTTNSCVGVWRNGVVEIIANDQGNRTTPSCVAFTGSQRLVGEGANHQVATNASNTIFDVKRLMGRSLSEASVENDAKYWPFGVMQGPDGKPLIRVSYLGEDKGFSPEEISAMVLVKMKETAEAYVRRPIKDAVITVPAYFNASQRQATKDAGVIAGLNVLRIINEATAAAIAYALNTNWRERTVLVYDLGGGTLDVSVVVISRDGLQVKATAGDTHLGGEDFTNNMVDYLVEEFKKKNPDIMGDISDDKKALGRLRRSCEVAKKKLSTNLRIPVEVYALFEGIDFHSEITREQFEKLNDDLFRRCMEPVAKCLMGGHTKVDDVLLVGACTRMPRLHQLVKHFFTGKEPCRNVNADEAVASGATALAAMLTLTGSIPAEILDITPFTLGITLDGVMWEVIERYTTIPTRKETGPFYRVNDAQYSVDITVYEDGRAMTNKFSIASHPKNKVLFEINQDGILQVSVWAQEGWKTFTNLLGFSKEEMEGMMKDAQKYKDQDEKHKKNVQARNDFQTLLFTISNNVTNLQDSAARLLVHQEATHEQDLQTPVYQDTTNSTRQVNKPHKAQDKDNRKMMQAHNDTINKLQYSIKELQETADKSANWIERKELTTDQIIGQMEQIEGDYNRITSHIEHIQARNDIQNLLFTISNNMKNLEDSAARLFIHPEATREQDLQTPRFQDTRARNSTSQVYKPHMVQDNDNREMVQAHHKLKHNIKKLQDTVDGTAKWLETKELTTIQIIVKMEQIKVDYNSISSQMENIQAWNDIKNMLFIIINNMKNLEDSATGLLIHSEAIGEQDLQIPRYQDTKECNSTSQVYKPHMVQDKDSREMVQAHHKLQYNIKQLKNKADGTTKRLEKKELTTDQIIVQMEQIKGDYNSISSQIENIQARNNIKNMLFTIRNNMKNLEDSATGLLIYPEATGEQDLQTPRYKDTKEWNSTSQVYKPHMVQDKHSREMVQAHHKLQYDISQLKNKVDGTTKWLENKELSTNKIIGQMEQIKGDYSIISNQIKNIQAQNDIQNFFFTITNNMKNLEDSAARLLIHPEEIQEKDFHTPGYQDTMTRKSTRQVHTPHKTQDMQKSKMIQALNDTIKKLQDKADVLTTNEIIGQMKKIDDDYNIISSQIQNIQARIDIENSLFTIRNNVKNLEASVAKLLVHREASRGQDLQTVQVIASKSTSHFRTPKGHDKEKKKMIQAPNDTIMELQAKGLQNCINKLVEKVDVTTKWLESKELSTYQIITKKEQIEGDYNNISCQIESASQ